MSRSSSRVLAAAVIVCLGCPSTEEPAPTQVVKPSAASTSREGTAEELALVANASAFVQQLESLEKSKDVTCWTSFRQLDSFIGGKQYSDFATLTKVEAAKVLVRSVWAAASKKAAATEVTVADLESVFSMEAELPAAKKAELEKFAQDQGWQQFRDYRTTSEHWRILLAVVSEELAFETPALKPLQAEAQERLALSATRLSLSLLTESGEIATQARTPMIEAEHVRVALANILERHAIPRAEPLAGKPDHAKANEARIPLTGKLITAKISALREYNAASADMHVELSKLVKMPLDQDAGMQMVGELMSMARFFTKGFEPMRADNYLADGNFAPGQLAVQPYIDAAHVENVTQQIFPYLMLPNGDVKLHFEPRPGHVSPRELDGQDVLMTDHSMNAVRDTALHWVVLQRVYRESPYALDPFAAEYLSELVSIVATFYLLRAQTLAKQNGKDSIDVQTIKNVRDVGFVQVMPEAESSADWGEEQLAAKAAVVAGYGGPLFEDVTGAWGLPTSLDAAAKAVSPGATDFDIQEVMGAGVAVGDLDANGFADFFIAGEGLGRLFLNDGKRLVDATEKLGIPSGLDDSRGALFVDYDGDDDLDLLVLRSKHPSLLLSNPGEGGALVDVAKSVGLVTTAGAHTATAFDYDGDDDLDLYVGYYGSKACNDGACKGRNLPSLDGRNGTPNQLFRNDGAAFVDVGGTAGVADVGWTLGASAIDFDADGDQDLVLANDFGANPLYANAGDGTFSDVALDLGAADRGSGMNVSFADVDGSGTFDLFVSNIDMFSKNIKIVFPKDESVVGLSDRILQSFQYISGNKLYLNNVEEGGARRFAPAERTYFEPGDRGWGWAGLFFDYDADGDEDFYLSNGWIPGSPAADQANLMFVRDADTFYAMPPQPQGEGFAANSRSAVVVDVDRDGRLDLVVNNFADSPRLLRNTQQGPKAKANNSLALRLVGPGKNTRGVGATIEVRSGKSTQRRAVTCGDGYLGQQDEVILVGLGGQKAAEVTVTWPNAKTQSFGQLKVGKTHRLVAK